jgi:hypothetical protein
MVPEGPPGKTGHYGGQFRGLDWLRNVHVETARQGPHLQTTASLQQTTASLQPTHIPKIESRSLSEIEEMAAISRDP